MILTRQEVKYTELANVEERFTESFTVQYGKNENRTFLCKTQKLINAKQHFSLVGIKNVNQLGNIDKIIGARKRIARVNVKVFHNTVLEFRILLDEQLYEQLLITCSYH